MAKYYAVAVGHNPGIYRSWSDCSPQVTGYSRAKFRKFYNRDDAQDFIDSFRLGLCLPLYSDSSDSTPAISGRIGYITYANNGYSTSLESFQEVQQIFTDGAARGNQFERPLAGYGVYFGPGDYRNVAVPLGDVDGRRVRHTNQRAELHAVGHALREIENSASVGDDISYEIYTDSQYAVNALEVWTPKWRDRDWISAAGREVVNRDIIEDASDLLDHLRDCDVDIELYHVRGHGDCEGNIEADRLANIGADRDYY